MIYLKFTPLVYLKYLNFVPHVNSKYPIICPLYILHYLDLNTLYVRNIWTPQPLDSWIIWELHPSMFDNIWNMYTSLTWHIWNVHTCYHRHNRYLRHSPFLLMFTHLKYSYLTINYDYDVGDIHTTPPPLIHSRCLICKSSESIALRLTICDLHHHLDLRVIRPLVSDMYSDSTTDWWVWW